MTTYRTFRRSTAAQIRRGTKARIHGRVDATVTDRDRIVALAMGRIFRLGSRPSQPGDIEEYERCRAIILDALDPLPHAPVISYARDRGKGAAGD